MTTVKSLLLSLLIILLPATLAYGTIYTASNSGDWSAAATWGGTAPGDVIAGGDQVIIPAGITVELDNDIAINAPTSSIEVSGELVSSTGNSIGVNSGTLAGTGLIDVAQVGVASSGLLTFSGQLELGNLGLLGSNFAVSAQTNISDTLAVSNGTFSLQSAGTLSLDDNATINLDEGELLNAGGTINATGTVNLAYNGTAASTGLESTIGTIGNVAVDLDNSSSEFALTNDLEVTGTLHLQNGQLLLGNHHLTISGDADFSANGSISASDEAELTINTSGSLTSKIAFAGGSDTLKNLTIDVASGNEAGFDSDVHINGELDLVSGTLSITDHDVAIHGSLSSNANSHLATNAGTNLWVQASGNVNGALQFEDTANTVNDLVIDLGSASEVSVNSELTIDGTLEFNNGKLTINNEDLTLTGNASISGASAEHFIQTEGSGYVNMTITDGDGIVEFPVGTETNGFAAAGINVNSSAGNGTYKVNVQNDVLAQGTTGMDLSATEMLVDNTWLVDTDVAGSVDADVHLTWEDGAEVNGFDNENAFVSKYASGIWDTVSSSSATSNSNGTYTLARNGVNSLGPFAVLGDAAASGNIYTAVASGDWSADVTWGGTSPGPVVDSGEQVVIPVGIEVNQDIDVEVNNSASSVEVLGSLTSSTEQAMTVSSGNVIGTGAIDIGSLMLDAGAALAFTGDLSVNNFSTNEFSLALAAMATVHDTLSISESSLTVQGTAGLTLDDGIAIMIHNGSLGNTGVSLASNGEANLFFSGDSNSTSGEIGLGTINDVTVNFDSESDELALSSNLVIEGTLTVENGILDLNDNGMSLRSDLNLGANGWLKATGESSLSLKTGGSLSTPIKFEGGSDTLKGLTIDVGAGNEAAFDSDVAVNGTFNLTSGTMNIQGQDLAVNGNLTTSTDGELSTDNQTNLGLTAAGNVSGEINFNSTNNSLGDLVIDLGSTDSVFLGSALTVDGTLQLDNGKIVLGSNDLMLTANADIQGGSLNSYIQTGGSGSLGMELTAGSSGEFFVGTTTAYGKAEITLNSGSGDGAFYVNVMNDVLANGTTGVDITDTADAVDQTWDITTDAAGSVDANVALTWEGSAEVNNFDNANAYISHYTGGSWDASATASATSNANGTFTLTRDNISSLSPFAVFSEEQSQATTFTAIVDGDWSAGSTWDGGVSPGNSVDGGDDVLISSGVDVNLDTDVAFNDNNSSLEVLGTIHSDNNSELTMNQGSILGTGDIDIHGLAMHADATLVLAGDLTVNTFTAEGANFAISANTTVEDTLWISNGQLSLQTASVLDFDSDATIVIEDAGLINASGTISSSGSTHIVYQGGSISTSDELSVSSTGNVTVDLNSSSDELILESDLTVDGTLDVNSGTVVIGNNSVTLNGDFMATANGSLNASDQSNLAIQSSSDLSAAIVFSGGSDTLNNLTIDMGAGAKASFDADATINGTFQLLSGTIGIEDNTLALSGSAQAEADGEIAANGNSSIYIMTTAGVEGKLNFDGSDNSVNEFIVDLGSSSDTVSLGSEVNVEGTLQLDNGQVVIGDNNLMVAAGASVQGGGTNSYVQTSGDGYLSINLSAGGNGEFHVGTAEGYAHAGLELNSGSSDGNYMVNVQNDVWAEGSTGFDISASESVVDHTWDITTDASGSVDVNVALTWEGAAEVNGFDNQSCYIAHYTNANWDANATASATANANGTFTITRDNMSELSPFAVFDENTSVGIDDAIAVQSLEMYPNPAEHTLIINSDLDESIPAQIHSIDGRMIKQLRLNSGHNEINVTNLEDGTYYLHLAGSESGLTFIKQ